MLAIVQSILLVATVLLSTISFQVGASENAGNCGELVNGYGPFDYTNPAHRQEKLPVVEDIHFTQEVENLTSGSTGTVESDLDYVLHAFPNHHRALYAMGNWQLRQGNRGGATYSAECYFDRAVRFRPGDAVSWMLYGMYEYKRGNNERALEKYEQALKVNPKLIEAHYNLGLLLVELERYDDAQKQAVEAYSAGFPLDGLKNKLAALGYWPPGTGGSDRSGQAKGK